MMLKLKPPPMLLLLLLLLMMMMIIIIIIFLYLNGCEKFVVIFWDIMTTTHMQQ
jgi:hypothetical protein